MQERLKKLQGYEETAERNIQLARQTNNDGAARFWTVMKLRFLDAQVTLMKAECGQ